MYTSVDSGRSNKFNRLIWNGCSHWFVQVVKQNRCIKYILINQFNIVECVKYFRMAISVVFIYGFTLQINFATVNGIFVNIPNLSEGLFNTPTVVIKLLINLIIIFEFLNLDENDPKIYETIVFYLFDFMANISVVSDVKLICITFDEYI